MSLPLTSLPLLFVWLPRDPNSMATLSAFRRGVDWARSGGFSQQDVDEAKLSVFSSCLCRNVLGFSPSTHTHTHTHTHRHTERHAHTHTPTCWDTHTHTHTHTHTRPSAADACLI